MDLYLYIPALIILGASVVAFFAGVFAFILALGYSDWESFWVALGIFLVYGSPVAALIAVGMQIAHWV